MPVNEAAADSNNQTPRHLRQSVGRVSGAGLLGHGDGMARSDDVLLPRVRRGDLSVDLSTWVITLRGHHISATAYEAKLLAALMSTPLRTHTCGDLEHRVWGSGLGGECHVVDVHVGYLRRRLDVALRPAIAGSCATGYRLTSHYGLGSSTAASDSRRD